MEILVRGMATIRILMWSVVAIRAILVNVNLPILMTLRLGNLLRIEACKQGTLRCYGKTDNLCIGRDTVGGAIEPVTPVQNQTLYTLVLILRLFYLLLTQFH